MKFSLNQQDLQKSLNYCQGVIEKRSTLPILSNILLEAKMESMTKDYMELKQQFEEFQKPKRGIKKWVSHPQGKDW